MKYRPGGNSASDVLSLKGREKVTVRSVVRVVMTCSSLPTVFRRQEWLWRHFPPAEIEARLVGLLPVHSSWPASPAHLGLANLLLMSTGSPGWVVRPLDAS